MNRSINRVLSMSLVSLALFSCASTPTKPAKRVEPQKTEAKVANPVLAEWTGPYGGVPAFDQVKVEQFSSAIEGAMAAQLVALEKIAADPAPASFDNTIAAMERAERPFDRVMTFFGVWSSAMNSPEFQKVERVMAPKLAAFSDKITQNEKLFARIAAVYKARETACKNAEQKRLAWVYYTHFVRAGAELDATAKKRVAAINEKLAGLFTLFTQNLLAEENGHTLVLKTEEDLAGLPPSVREAAAQAAKTKKLGGVGAVMNTRSSMEPFLTYSTRRDLREQVWTNYINRGDNANEQNNNKTITEIFALRAERAALLGYKTHAHWRLENTMAKTPERAMSLMQAVWPAAVARVHEEVADMRAIVKKEGGKFKIAPWDYRHYAEKVRKAKYDIDENEVKPYMQLDKLRDGMFWVAEKLFDLHFSPAHNVPVYHPDVTVFEVKDGKGKFVALWYFDPWARQGKRSGAWMNAYRDQEKMDGDVATIVSNNSNFVKGKPGEPVLISWTDAETLFHEFGHALHGICSNVTYPSLSGTSVARDYVEFPSQILERWLSTPEVLNKFALHVETNKPLPPALLEKLKRAGKFNQGFQTVEYLSAALVDMKAHLAGAEPIDPKAFETKTLAELKMPKEIVMRHRMPQFAHLFAGDSYSAGYYSYLWSDTISSDAYEAFTEAGGPYDETVSAKLKAEVFSIGNTVDPADAYRAFRGRDAGIGALMRDRGFPDKTEKVKPQAKTTKKSKKRKRRRK